MASPNTRLAHMANTRTLIQDYLSNIYAHRTLQVRHHSSLEKRVGDTEFAIMI